VTHRMFWVELVVEDEVVMMESCELTDINLGVTRSRKHS
jgi:hypothetical protein